jgi:endonuclease I
MSYAEVWGALDFTDEDPDNADNVILLYTGRSHPKPDKVSSVLNPNHDNDSWNREHVWPKSHGFPSEGQLAHTDIHHLRPADVTCNSDRGNLDFDESEFAHPDCASRRDADSWTPPSTAFSGRLRSGGGARDARPSVAVGFGGAVAGASG